MESNTKQLALNMSILAMLNGDPVLCGGGGGISYLSPGMIKYHGQKTTFKRIYLAYGSRRDLTMARKTEQ